VPSILSGFTRQDTHPLHPGSCFAGTSVTVGSPCSNVETSHTSHTAQVSDSVHKMLQALQCFSSSLPLRFICVDFACCGLIASHCIHPSTLRLPCARLRHGPVIPLRCNSTLSWPRGHSDGLQLIPAPRFLAGAKLSAAWRESSGTDKLAKEDDVSSESFAATKSPSNLFFRVAFGLHLNCRVDHGRGRRSGGR